MDKFFYWIFACKAMALTMFGLVMTVARWIDHLVAADWPILKKRPSTEFELLTYIAAAVCYLAACKALERGYQK